MIVFRLLLLQLEGFRPVVQVQKRFHAPHPLLAVKREPIIGAQYDEDGQSLMKAAALVMRPVQYLKDPLRRNSAFLMASHGVLGLLGLFFWAIAARLYEQEQVDLAAALVSAVLLLHTLARLGLDIGMIRFLPDEKDKSAMMNTCFSLVAVFSVVLAVAFVLGVRTWSPELRMVRDEADYFVVFILFAGAVSLVDLLRQGAFVALRRTEFSLLMEMIAGLRLPLLLAMVSLGALGIFCSWGIASCIALVAALFFIARLQRGYRPAPMVDRGAVGRLLNFSLVSYMAESLRELPGFLLPLLVVNALDLDLGADFYITWTLASVILMIAYATSFSLLAEVSREPGKFGSDAVRAMKFILLLLVPAILIVFFAGDWILSLFGDEYAENGADLLRLLTVSGIPVSFNILYITWKRLRQEVWPIVYLYAFVAAFTIGVGYALMQEMGLAGIGVAWLSANGGVTVLLGLGLVRNRIRSRNTKGG
jgi:O-antigen/teichoic acid export membrane protein